MSWSMAPTSATHLPSLKPRPLKGPQAGRARASCLDQEPRMRAAGGMPQRDFLRGIELLGTEVLPQIRAEWQTP